MNPIGLVFVAIGIFALLGSICDWEFFMNSRKGARMSKMIGRNRARILYAAIGTLVLVIGVLITAGILDSASN